MTSVYAVLGGRTANDELHCDFAQVCHSDELRRLPRIISMASIALSRLRSSLTTPCQRTKILVLRSVLRCVILGLWLMTIDGQVSDELRMWCQATRSSITQGQHRESGALICSPTGFARWSGGGNVHEQGWNQQSIRSKADIEGNPQLLNNQYTKWIYPNEMTKHGKTDFSFLECYRRVWARQCASIVLWWVKGGSSSSSKLESGKHKVFWKADGQ